MRAVAPHAVFGSMLILATQQVLAQTANLPSFEFRGHTVGEPIEQHFPYWNLGFRSLDLPYCSQEKTGEVTCADPTVQLDSRGSRKEVGGVPIKLLYYTFVNGRLTRVDMGFHVRGYSDIRSMLVGKYGQPESERTEEIQNRAGAKFDNVLTDWKFREGTLRLELRYTSIDTSWLRLINPQADREAAERSRKIGEEKGKKAF